MEGIEAKVRVSNAQVISLMKMPKDGEVRTLPQSIDTIVHDATTVSHTHSGGQTYVTAPKQQTTSLKHYRDSNGKIVTDAYIALEFVITQEDLLNAKDGSILSLIEYRAKRDGVNVNLVRSSYYNPETNERGVGWLLKDAENPNSWHYHIEIDGQLPTWQHKGDTPALAPGREGVYVRLIKHKENLDPIEKWKGNDPCTYCSTVYAGSTHAPNKPAEGFLIEKLNGKISERHILELYRRGDLIVGVREWGEDRMPRIINYEQRHSRIGHFDVVLSVREQGLQRLGYERNLFKN
jgi:hypothetical protein